MKLRVLSKVSIVLSIIAILGNCFIFIQTAFFGVAIDTVHYLTSIGVLVLFLIGNIFNVFMIPKEE